MDHITDYIGWMGDFPIRAIGFQDADALVLCMLSYFDFRPLRETAGEDMRVRDCIPLLASGKIRVLITGADMGYMEVLKAAAGSARYGDLRIVHAEDILSSDPPLQFSAVTFQDEDSFGFIAYRGTDSSLAGWREDFMISFTHTRSQELALEYAREHVCEGRRWYLGGHSKGGNEALYAACMLEDGQWARVERLYILDGPGLCPEVDDGSKTRRVDEKTVRIIPVSSVVGRLFEPKIRDTRIVKSSAIGIMQHALPTWGVDHGKLLQVAENDAFSQWVHSVMDKWISGISLEDRMILVDDLFSVFEESGVQSLEEVPRVLPEKLDRILLRLSKMSPVTRKIALDLPKVAFLTSLGIQGKSGGGENA